MSGRLAGRTSLVVGGASGIGLAVARRFAAEGSAVTVLDRSVGACEQLTASDPALRVVRGDAVRGDDVAAAVAVAVADDGGLHDLVCCAGIHDRFAAVAELPVDSIETTFDELFAANVLSAVLAVRHAAPALRAARGAVTLTVSESAYGPRGGGPLYAATKWALRGLVEHLAAEFAPDVRVNGVSPGGTEGTRLAGPAAIPAPPPANPGERAARIAAGNLLHVVIKPDELAAWFVQLADPIASRAVTGTVARVDGGH